MENNFKIWFILILALLIIGYVIYRKNFKRLVLSAVNLITGAPKTGKSLLSVKLSGKEFKHRHRVWFLKAKIFGKKGIEEPLFYTNAFYTFGNRKKMLKMKKRGRKYKQHPLDRCIVQIELEHFMREKRFNYGSVIYIQESSLMADNQDFNNQKRNAQLSMFNKLIGHETKGGILFYDTQSPLDNHYAIKRVVSNYYFIQKSRNFILFRILYVREMISTDLGQNNFTEDVDISVKKVFVGRWWYKHYDRYYFSFLTDDLSNESKKIEFYTGGLNSFNPLYRKLSLRRKEDIKNEKENVQEN